MAEYFEMSYSNGYTASLYAMHQQDVPIIIPMDAGQIETAIKTDSKLSSKYYQNRIFAENVERLKDNIRFQITRGIASEKSWLDIAYEVAYAMNSPFRRALNDAFRIVRTEGHRINQQAFLDAGFEAKLHGADVLKQWDATLDSRTRPAHQVADGQLKEWDDYFIVDGEKMEAPGVGGSAKNVCNCRCQLLQRAKWMLGSHELYVQQERARFFGLDKSKSFEEFKENYMHMQW